MRDGAVGEQTLRALEIDVSVLRRGLGLLHGGMAAREFGGTRAGDELLQGGFLNGHVRGGGLKVVVERARIELRHDGSRSHALPFLERHRLDPARDAEAELHLSNVDVAVERDEVRGGGTAADAPRADEPHGDAHDRHEPDDEDTCPDGRGLHRFVPRGLRFAALGMRARGGCEGASSWAVMFARTCLWRTASSLSPMADQRSWRKTAARATRKTSICPRIETTVSRAVSSSLGRMPRMTRVSTPKVRSAKPRMERHESLGDLALLADDELGPIRGFIAHEERQSAVHHAEQELEVPIAELLLRRARGRLLERVLQRVYDRAEARPELACDVLERRDVQALLAAEVVADERLLDPRGLGDRAGAGEVEAVSAEDFDGRGDERDAGGVAARARVGRRSGHAGDLS